jgi:hypothetical protein
VTTTNRVTVTTTNRSTRPRFCNCRKSSLRMMLHLGLIIHSIMFLIRGMTSFWGPFATRAVLFSSSRYANEEFGRVQCYRMISKQERCVSMQDIFVCKERFCGQPVGHEFYARCMWEATLSRSILCMISLGDIGWTWCNRVSGSVVVVVDSGCSRF